MSPVRGVNVQGSVPCVVVDPIHDLDAGIHVPPGALSAHPGNSGPRDADGEEAQRHRKCPFHLDHVHHSPTADHRAEQHPCRTDRHDQTGKQCSGRQIGRDIAECLRGKNRRGKQKPFRVQQRRHKHRRSAD